MFLSTIRPKNDFNYFPGAKLNEPNRPIAWYSPKGDEKYSVVYADLSVVDTTKDKLPANPTPDADTKIQFQAKPAVPKPQVEQLPKHNVAPWNTPTFKLPSSAATKWSDVERIRKQGKQRTLKHLALWMMPEFLEQIPADANGIVVQENWSPNRDADSLRLGLLLEFPNLTGLQLDHLYLTQKDLDAVANCSKLERLSLSGVQIMQQDGTARRLNSDDLKKLSVLKRLRTLDLSQSNFGGGLKHLKELPNLTTLFLNSFEGVNDQSLKDLKNLPHLKTLVLHAVYAKNSDRTVTENGLDALQAIPHLKTLYVAWHGEWTLPIDKLRKLLPNAEVKP